MVEQLFNNSSTTIPSTMILQIKKMITFLYNLTNKN
jgi:hypothetical protein